MALQDHGGNADGFFNIKKYFLAKNLKKDIPSSIVVFLVALPLCLGIALASGAPLFSGVLTGIVGGIVVGTISGSQLSVAGPAAGLTAIVLAAIGSLGYETFLVAVVLGGCLQLIFGLIRAGIIANYFPSSVIEGMLAAIGIILIMKQIPHAVGYDADFVGDESFSQPDHENTFSAILSAVSKINYGAVIIAVVSLLILNIWPKIKKVALIPAPLIVVVLGSILAAVFSGTGIALQKEQYVVIPVVNSAAEFFGLFKIPDFSQVFSRSDIWVTAVTIALVASLESLLSLEAVDKIDPLKRVSPTNRELIAQGTGNIISGMLGGLPLTAVIVRSSANVNAGARTKVSAITHGFLLLSALLIIPALINMIPLSCLAAILLMTGYKLTRIALFKHMWHKGIPQFVPFVVTILAVVLIDLLKGVGIGIFVAGFFILYTNLRNPYFYKITHDGEGKKVIHINLAEEVSFLNKAAIQVTLASLPKSSDVLIDGTNSRYIDPDVLEIIHNFRHNAFTKGIVVQLKNIKDKYDVPKLKELSYKA